MEFAHVNEEAYLNKLVAYWLQFEGYKYDMLISKLVEVLVTIFQKNSLVQVGTIATNSRNELHYINGGKWRWSLVLTKPKTN